MTKHPSRKEAEKANERRYAELASSERNGRLSPAETREFARLTLTAAGVLAAVWDKEKHRFNYSMTAEGVEFFQIMHDRRDKTYDYYYE